MGPCSPSVLAHLLFVVFVLRFPPPPVIRLARCVFLTHPHFLCATYQSVSGNELASQLLTSQHVSVLELLTSLLLSDL